MTSPTFGTLRSFGSPSASRIVASDFPDSFRDFKINQALFPFVSAMASKSSFSAAEAAALSIASAALAALGTYVVTGYVESLREEKARALRRAELNAERALSKKKQEQNGNPKGTLIQDVRIDEIYLWEVQHLGEFFPSEAAGLENHMHGVGSYQKYTDDSTAGNFSKLSMSTHSADESDSKKTHYNKLIGSHECILSDLVRKPGAPGVVQKTKAYCRAGPRREMHFNPKNVNAAIVTCGGLCPGLNNVVREITNALVHLYGIGGKIYGIRGGYNGFVDEIQYPPIELTPEVVEDIHHSGGTILSSSRGGFDLEKILAFLKKRKINQVYVIGGDGTHRGAFRIHEGCLEAGMNVAVAGIPKTIDNDIDYIDRSFGFASSVEAAQDAIRSAKTEATCNRPNGIGIVKLMGRSAGFIAVHATLGSGDVDLCLVPEVDIVLDGPDGCLPFLRRRVKNQGYAVVVVAEGAGEELMGTSAEVDASGNKKLPKIGEFMKEQIEKHFKEQGEVATVKYIDPSYMIRSVPANASDSLYCMQLAQNAVHGSFAGFTGFSVGLCNNKMVFLPIPELVETSPRSMNPRGRTWERVLARTRQPNTVPPLKPGEKEVDSHAPMLR